MSIEIKNRGKVETILFDTLKRAILRKNYTSVKEISEKISLLYSAEKITVEQYMQLMELLYEGGEE